MVTIATAASRALSPEIGSMNRTESVFIFGYLKDELGRPDASSSEKAQLAEAEHTDQALRGNPQWKNLHEARDIFQMDQFLHKSEVKMTHLVGAAFAIGVGATAAVVASPVLAVTAVVGGGLLAYLGWRSSSKSKVSGRAVDFLHGLTSQHKGNWELHEKVAELRYLQSFAASSRAACSVSRGFEV